MSRVCPVCSVWLDVRTIARHRHFRGTGPLVPRKCRVGHPLADDLVRLRRPAGTRSYTKGPWIVCRVCAANRTYTYHIWRDLANAEAAFDYRKQLVLRSKLRVWEKYQRKLARLRQTGGRAYAVYMLREAERFRVRVPRGREGEE